MNKKYLYLNHINSNIYLFSIFFFGMGGGEEKVNDFFIPLPVKGGQAVLQELQAFYLGKWEFINILAYSEVHYSLQRPYAAYYSGYNVRIKQKSICFLLTSSLREAAKKNPPIMARQLRPYPPPPSGIMAHGNFFYLFFLNS